MEEWRSVLGYEGLYEVSDLGRVRSLRRNTTSGKILKLLMYSPRGYPQVCLYRDGHSKRIDAHVLVCEAFHGPRPDGMEVRHGPDPTKTNIAASNLQWGTSSENKRDSVEHGTWRNQNTGKTHCKRGHPLSGDNLYEPKHDGSRQCRTCRLDYRRRRANNEK